MRILLIEDDTGIASFVVKGLKEAGYCVEHVGDGQTGFERLVDDSFDAAIVDIMLPEKSGALRTERSCRNGQQ
jgi:two-component system OmpR family response regulator